MRRIIPRSVLPTLLFLSVFAMFVPSRALAADVRIKDDASTSSQEPNKNTATDHFLSVERTAGNNPRAWNSYIRFNLATLPAGAVGNDVVKATLRLWVSKVTTAGSFDVHRVTGAWNEFGLTFATAPGSLAEVTGIAMTAMNDGSFVTVDLTALVRDWLNGPGGGGIANNGIALVANAAGTSVLFDSKENEHTGHEASLEILLKGSVEHDSTLAGDGTSSSPLGIASGGVGTNQLANGAVTGEKIASGQVVKSLNSLTDDVTLSAGTNLTITPSGNSLTIAAPNTLTSVARDATLTGNGTGGSPLGVANGGIGNLQLGNNAVTANKIAAGQVVKSLNGLFDNVTLSAGANITITPSGNTLTFSTPGALSAVVHNSTLSGNGTGGSPLGISVPLILSGAYSVPGISAIIQGINTSDIGVYGKGGGGFPGVYGEGDNAPGVSGLSQTSCGVCATSGSGNALAVFTSTGSLIEGFDGSLDVKFRVKNNGDVQADGSYTSPAADFAEMLGVEPLAKAAEATYQPGDVLIISPDTGKLRKANQPYSHLVAGVYSTKPAFLGGHEVKGESPDDRVPVALVGIVPCKVTAQNGPIKVGDLLVTSSMPGYAMKGSRRSRMLGAVMGKALEPLRSGTGIIKVLVTLQ